MQKLEFALQIPKPEGERVIVSTEDKNDYDIIVLTDGVILDRFLKNPIMLKNHRTDEIIGRWEELEITEDKKLIGKPVFIDTEAGNKAKAEFEAGALNAASIGFMPLKYTYVEDDAEKVEVIVKGEKREIDLTDPKYKGAYMIITEWSLDEISLVAIPANENATKLTLSNFFSEEHFECDLDFEILPYRDYFDKIRENLEETKDWLKYSQHFASTTLSKNPSDYKLLHHLADGKVSFVLLVQALKLSEKDRDFFKREYEHLLEHSRKIAEELNIDFDFSKFEATKFEEEVQKARFCKDLPKPREKELSYEYLSDIALKLDKVLFILEKREKNNDDLTFSIENKLNKLVEDL